MKSPRIITALLVFVFSLPAFAQSEKLAQNYRYAEAKVRPWTVRIETIGGREKVKGEMANNGATTGILLTADGHIVSSSFNFLHDPSSILITFSDGTKKVARKVATDHSRLLTLLKVDNLATDFLKLPEGQDAKAVAVPYAPKNEIKTGQWAIALGAALSNVESNLSVGIVSGNDRIWGKALQTDAAISPNNYGGPLIDLQGRVLGILAPLSMMSDDVVAGAETYDGGVGMAVYMEDFLAAFPKLSQGTDLFPGDPGFAFKMNTLFTAEPIIEAIAPASEAERAGLKAGDKLIKINGVSVQLAVQAQSVLKRLYEEDKIELLYLRDGKEATVQWTIPKTPKKN